MRSGGLIRSWPSEEFPQTETCCFSRCESETDSISAQRHNSKVRPSRAVFVNTSRFLFWFSEVFPSKDPFPLKFGLGFKVWQKGRWFLVYFESHLSNLRPFETVSCDAPCVVTVNSVKQVAKWQCRTVKCRRQKICCVEKHVPIGSSQRHATSHESEGFTKVRGFPARAASLQEEFWSPQMGQIVPQHMQGNYPTLICCQFKFLTTTRHICLYIRRASQTERSYHQSFHTGSIKGRSVKTTRACVRKVSSVICSGSTHVLSCSLACQHLCPCQTTPSAGTSRP